jgi:hypothetical protein
MQAETSLHRDRDPEAMEPARAAALRSSQIGDDPLLIYSLELLAASTAGQGQAERAAMLLGAADAARHRMELEPDEDEAAVRDRAGDALRRTMASEDLAAATAAGRALDLRAALAEVTTG